MRSEEPSSDQRNWPVDNKNERMARRLVSALYFATDGETGWRGLPRLHDQSEAIAFAVARGWVVDCRDRFYLTEAGRNLVRDAEEDTSKQG